MQKMTWGIVLTAAVALWGACNEPIEPACVPGITQSCLCLGGEGVQACNSEGTGFTACECPSATSDAHLAPDVTTDWGGTQAEDISGPDMNCTPQALKACKEGNVVWLDSCGNYGGIAEACGENSTCSGDTCIEVCTPHAAKYCLKNAIYWYDSCGEAEGPAELCGDEQFCKGCTVDEAPCDGSPNCIKPFYNGTWEMVANPDTQTACGGLSETKYFKQKLVLEVDGSDATGQISVANIQVDYTGTITGKKLVLTGSYSQTDLGVTIDHDETIEVEFESLNSFSGLHIDSYDLIGLPCTVYWDVTGTKL